MSEIRKDCPVCEGELRSVPDIGGPFLGCSDCDYEEDMPIAAQLRAQGAETLPGFDDKSLGVE